MANRTTQEFAACSCGHRAYMHRLVQTIPIVVYAAECISGCGCRTATFPDE